MMMVVVGKSWWRCGEIMVVGFGENHGRTTVDWDGGRLS